MRARIIVICGFAVLIGCSHYQGSGGSGSVIYYMRGPRIAVQPSAEKADPTVQPPGNFPCDDREQIGPKPEIDGTRDWNRDVLPVGPGLLDANRGCFRL